MRRVLSVLVFLLGCSSAQAQDELTLQEWLDLFIESCVGSGSSFFVSGSVDAGVGISLQKLKGDGSIAGKVTITKSNYKLLSEGISNAMSDATAAQADKIRECLAPVRQNLLQAMNQQMGDASTLSAPIYILSPYEERVLKSLASRPGLSGETGKEVPKDRVLSDTNMSDIRFRATIRQLQSKLLADEWRKVEMVGTGVDVSLQEIPIVSLWPDGEEYVLRMGYAQ